MNSRKALASTSRRSSAPRLQQHRVIRPRFTKSCRRFPRQNWTLRSIHRDARDDRDPRPGRPAGPKMLERFLRAGILELIFPALDLGLGTEVFRLRLVTSLHPDPRKRCVDEQVAGPQ